MANYLELSLTQVAAVASLILVNAILSVALRLRLERSLLFASVRTIVQLALIGLVLEWIFEQTQWYWVILLATLMTTVAGLTAASRTQRRYQGMWLDSLISVWVSSWLATAITLQIIRQDETNWLAQIGRASCRER